MTDVDQDVGPVTHCRGVRNETPSALKGAMISPAALSLPVTAASSANVCGRRTALPSALMSVSARNTCSTICSRGIGGGFRHHSSA